MCYLVSEQCSWSDSVESLTVVGVVKGVRHLQLLFGRMQWSTFEGRVTTDDTQVDVRGFVDSMHRVQDFRNDFECSLKGDDRHSPLQKL